MRPSAEQMMRKGYRRQAQKCSHPYWVLALENSSEPSRGYNPPASHGHSRPLAEMAYPAVLSLPPELF